MAFSKAVLLVVFAVLLISAEVSAIRDLAETTTTSTTDQYDRGSYQRIEGGKLGEGVECSKTRNKACSEVPKCKTNPYNRECYQHGNGGKGGNGEKGGRGAPGPNTKN